MPTEALKTGSLPKVSVVVPVHNAEDWLEGTLTSILRQTYNHQSLEIILVDDGSSDGGIALAEQTLKKGSIESRIKVVTNGGPARARNLGWQQARGEWIQFLDADDLLDPQKISTQMEAVSSLGHQVAVIYSDWQRFVERPNQNREPLGGIVSPTINDPIQDLMTEGNFIATGSQLFRRTWLQKISGFNEDYWLVEDVDLLLRLAMAGAEFHRVPSAFPLFFYRQHKKSLSHGNSKEFIRACLRNAQMVERWWQQHGELSAAQRMNLVRSYGMVARGSFGKDPSTFELAYNLLKRLSPRGRYIPEGPLGLIWASKLLGYRHAEGIAWRYRWIKQKLMLGFHGCI